MTPNAVDLTKRIVLGGAGIFAAGLAWQLFADSGAVDIRFSSSPMRIANAGAVMLSTREFWISAGSSAQKFFLGMLMAGIVGIPLGLVMGWNKRLRQTLEPLAIVFYSVPSTIFMPLLILQLGIGINAFATVVFFGAVFPMLLNSMAGIRNVETRLVQAARTFGANGFDIFRFVLLPSALPMVMVGIRLGLGRGLMAVILAEMYFSIAGFGHLIMRYQAGLNTDRLMVIVVCTAVFGLLLISLARWAEDKLGPWRRNSEDG